MQPDRTSVPFRAGLGLGSNVGDGMAQIARALRLTESRNVARVVKVSSLWRTPPWGYADQPPFANACALLETELLPQPLLKALKIIETDMGRQPGPRWGPRLIDLDILFFDDHVMESENLTLPHKDMLSRVFVLAPLAEIAPDLVLSGQSVTALLKKLDQTGLEIRHSGSQWWQVKDDLALVSDKKLKTATM